MLSPGKCTNIHFCCAALVQVGKDPEVFSEMGDEGFDGHQRISQTSFPFLMQDLWQCRVLSFNEVMDGICPARQALHLESQAAQIPGDASQQS